MCKAVLIVPAFEPGRGGGHLSRCIRLTADLRALGREAWLYLPAHSDDTDKLFKSMNFNPQWRITNNALQNICANVEYIILDRFQTPSEELTRWKEIAPVIGIDEGGTCRDSFDFLVDILPNLEKIKPNITNPALLNLPRKTPHAESSNQRGAKILISFGHEDSAGLGLAVAQALANEDCADIEITLLRGRLNNATHSPLPTPHSLKVLESIPNLAECISEYDLIITHYGITAFEALYAGTPVLLVNPTRYHEELAKAAGFLTVGSKFNLTQRRKDAEGQVQFVDNAPISLPLYLSGRYLKNSFLKLKKNCEALAVKYGLDKEGVSLSALINGFSPIVSRRCPVCGGNTPIKSIARFSERTYRHCPACGVIFMDRVNPAPVEYGREYFFEQYKQQYGKTYIEDFPNLMAMAKRRIKIIKSKLCASASMREEFKFTLLDIGCAYGPFLAAAREEGFSPAGIDPAKDAVRYVQQELGIPAIQGFFPTTHYPLSTTHYNIITLWYVIEHFRDCVPVFAEIKKLLKPGGILAFSTPSFSGICGRSSLKRFLEHSPGDHFTIWSPKMCRKALALAGFKVRKIAVCGHHPERFPLLGKFARNGKSPLYWVLLAISRIFALGDTFEVYAQAAF